MQQSSMFDTPSPQHKPAIPLNSSNPPKQPVDPSQGLLYIRSCIYAQLNTFNNPLSRKGFLASVFAEYHFKGGCPLDLTTQRLQIYLNNQS